MRAVLSVRGLCRSFGGVRAVDDVSFEVGAGEMVALIGPNGAGKSTCFNLLGGQMAAEAGEVWLEGQRIDGTPPHRLARLGVGRSFQVAAVFGSMRLAENLALAGGGEAELEAVGLGGQGARFAGALAYGELKRLELAMALAGRPRLLLMDEPAAGMGAGEGAALFETVRRLTRAAGMAVLFSEHDMDLVFGHADRVVVLAGGRVIAKGTGDAVRADAAVRAAYLG